MHCVAVVDGDAKAWIIDAEGRGIVTGYCKDTDSDMEIGIQILTWDQCSQNKVFLWKYLILGACDSM